jgi:putative phosphoribosyl transferase
MNDSSVQLLLQGNLSIPKKDAKGIVVFAHGSGSSRHSPRNHYVAQVLNKDGLATLLVDLLTPEEEESDNRTQKMNHHKIPGPVILNKFNINLLAKRFVSITDWVLQNPSTQSHCFLFLADTMETMSLSLS